MQEVCQLEARDIRQVNDVWVFDINDDGEHKSLKSADSKRLVPIHNQLMQIGILEFVQQQKNKKVFRLFPDISLGANGRYFHTFSRKFTRWLSTVEASAPQTSFHSFRHNFTDKLREANTEQYVLKALIGHADSSVTARYGSQIAPDILKTALDKVTYPNLEAEVFYGGV